MKFFRVLCLVFVFTAFIPNPCHQASAATFNSEKTTLNSTGATSSTTVDAYSTVMSKSITMPTGGGALLAISSFSTVSGLTGAPGRNGTWDLYDGTTDSQDVTRYMSGTNGTRIISAFNIFTGLAAGSNTISVRQATKSSGKDIKSLNGNMVLIPLKSSDASATLNYNKDTLTSTGVTTSSTSLTPVTGFNASVNLPAAGKIAVFCSLSSQSTAGGTKTGTWDIQVENTPSSGTYSTVGKSASRYIASADNVGVTTLMAITDAKTSGTFDIRVRHMTSSGSLKTMSATLAAVALSLGGGEYLPSFQANIASDTTTSAALEAVDGLSPTLGVIGGDEAFIGSQFNVASSSAGKIATLRDDFTGGVYSNQQSTNAFSNTAKKRSGGSVGLAEGLTAGTLNANLMHSITGGATLTTTNANLMGFALNSVPEPGTYALFGLGLAGMFITWVRRKRI
ncbi:PEP-CTERM sorting domain-containing protein [Candidatus Auribacterota bacterium]